MLQLLVHDPSPVGRTTVEDVLRDKRLDGVTAALNTVAQGRFGGCRQSVDLAGTLAAIAAEVRLIRG